MSTESYMPLEVTREHIFDKSKFTSKMFNVANPITRANIIKHMNTLIQKVTKEALSIFFLPEILTYQELKQCTYIEILMHS